MDDLTFRVVAAESAPATAAMSRYFTELNQRFDGGFNASAAAADAVDAFNPPTGRFVVCDRGADVVGCGGIQFLDTQRAEIRRMWVSSEHRGLGLGKRLLAHLEHEIALSGRSTVMLDTNATLTEAIAMYRRSGYVEIEQYNDNPYAHLWFTKQL